LAKMVIKFTFAPEAVKISACLAKQNFKPAGNALPA